MSMGCGVLVGADRLGLICSSILLSEILKDCFYGIILLCQVSVAAVICR
jgi:hypothetical protein